MVDIMEIATSIPNDVSPSPIPMPQAQGFWEYVILLVLSGGGAVAIKQLTNAYKSWMDAKGNRSRQIEVDRDGVVEKVVDMLQGQLDEQSEDYSRRLTDKDRYYGEELQRRSKINEENILRKTNAIRELQDENRRLRQLLSRYQDKYGYMSYPFPEDEQQG